MGEVCRSRDRRLSRDVALKAWQEDVWNDPTRRRDSKRRRAELRRSITPILLPIFDVAFEDRPAFIVSELVFGKALLGMMERGPIPVRKAIAIAMQIGDGLE
jgi:serine/threonine protein kinase